MNLPFPIQAYFDADERNDGEALIQTFAPDAVVRDEGQSYDGRSAIGAWWRDAKATSQFRHDLLDAADRGDTTEVRVQVSGEFPGSPVILTFTFRLRDNHILALEIRL